MGAVRWPVSRSLAMPPARSGSLSEESLAASGRHRPALVPRPASGASIVRNSAGAVYIAPAMILIGFVLVAPAVYGLVFSLYDIRYLRPTDYVGFGNYAYLVTDPSFLPVVGRSALFTAMAVLLTVGIALPVALWIDGLSGVYAFATQILIVLPWVVSSLIAALAFQWVFVNDVGWIVYALQSVGVTNFHPLSDPATAMAVLVLFATWRTLGFAVLLLLAGLKAIPLDLYEFAHIDGASGPQRFASVTVPMLRTPLMITLVILTVSNLNNVEGPLIVTAGGPAGATNVLPLDVYTRAFGQYDYNSAIPLGIGVFLANIVLALVYVRLMNRDG